MKLNIRKVLEFIGFVAIALWLVSCTPGPGAYSSPSPTLGAEYSNKEDARPAEERPGLATTYGKQIKDEWQKQSFTRKSTKPAGIDMVYYNNKKGFDAMSGATYKADSTREVAGGLVEWGIKGRFGFLPTYEEYRYGGRTNNRFVVGSAGSSYSIWIKNRCKSRVEVVLSVDGLDVIDGKPASFAKRGYVINPGETLEVKGWRSGWDSVARFEFSSVGASYANQRHGDARNVGVIGMAVFGEKGVDPWTWMPNEVKTRKTATPFSTAP